MCLIKECYNEYKKRFENRWLDNIDTSSNSDIELAFRKIKDFHEISFIFLSKSVISGEYISCEDTKHEIKSFIEGLLEGDFIGGDSVLSKLYELFVILNNNLLNSLRHYQHLIEISEAKYDNSENSQLLFSSLKLINLREERLFSYFNQLVIKTCLYDYLLPMDEDSFKGLLTLKFQIDDAITASNDYNLIDILSVLLKKCFFIIKKTRKSNFNFSINSTIETINPNKLDLGGLQLFTDKEKCKILSAKLVNELHDDIVSPNPKLESFVHLIRHNKETLKSISDRGIMDNILQIYDEFYHANKEESPITKKQEYNNFSLDSIRNYLYNCRFSFLTKFNELPFTEIEKELNTIQKIQIRGVKNFHPYEKGIECLTSRIEKNLEKDIFTCSLDELKLIEEKLIRLNGLIDSYNEAIKWCEFRKFHPFLLPFKESLIVDNNIDIFIPSTFSKAIYYNEQWEYLSEAKQKLRDYHTLFLVRKEQQSISQLNMDNQNRTLELEDVLKKYEKRTYELLGLFTAVITFLFGSVNIFTQNSNPSLPLLITNTMGLGFILLLFAGLLLLTTSKFILELPFKDFKKTTRFRFLLVFIIGYLVILAASYFSYPANLQKSTEKNNIGDVAKDYKISTQDKHSLTNSAKINQFNNQNEISRLDSVNRQH